MAELRPLVFLIFLGSSWGFYFSMLKIAVLSGISYVGIAALTTLGVGAGMIAIAVARGRKPGWSGRHHGFYLVCALSGYLVPIVTELVVIAHMPAGVLTLIVGMAPLVTFLIAWLVKTDRVTLVRGGGVLLGAFAIFAILLPDANTSEDVAWRWLLLATIVPVSYSIHHNFAARFWPGRDDSYQVACGEAVYASVLMIGLSLFTWQWQDVQTWNAGHTAIVIMALIALVDIYVYFELIRIKGPIYTSHANYVMIVSGVFWGMMIFAERPSPWMWLSAVLLLASLYLIGDRRTRGQAVEQENS